MVSSRNAVTVGALCAVDLLATFLLGLVHAVPFWTAEGTAGVGAREVTTLWTVCTHQPGQAPMCRPFAGFVSNDVRVARACIAMCTGVAVATLAVPLLSRVVVMEGAARAARFLSTLICAGVAIFIIAYGAPNTASSAASTAAAVSPPQTRVDAMVLAAVAMLLHAMASLEWHRAYHGALGHLVTSTRVTCLDPLVAVPGGGGVGASVDDASVPLTHLLNPSEAHSSTAAAADNNRTTTILPDGDAARRTAANVALGASWSALAAGTVYCLVTVNGGVFMGQLVAAAVANVTASFFSEHARVTISRRRRPPRSSIDTITTTRDSAVVSMSAEEEQQEEVEATVTITYHSPLVPLLQQDVTIPAGSIDGIGYDAHFGRLAILTSHSKSLLHAFPVASKEAGMEFAEHIVAALGLPASITTDFNS